MSRSAELATDAAELMGACYSGVLQLKGPAAIPWAGRFLRPLTPDDTGSEAAFAIAETRCDLAFTTLRDAWKHTRDPDFRGSLLTAVALTRLDKAYKFLLALALEGSHSAREALSHAAPAGEILASLNTIPE
jgi:hypothetical protein